MPRAADRPRREATSGAGSNSRAFPRAPAMPRNPHRMCCAANVLGASHVAFGEIHRPWRDDSGEQFVESGRC